MHSYSSTHGHGHGHGNSMVGPCPCGLFHPPNQCSSSSSNFSMLWPSSQSHYYNHNQPSTDHLYSPSPSSTTLVDCTLSLGTPSTRRSSSSSSSSGDNAQHRRSSSGCISNLCWDFLQPKHYSSHSTTTTTTTTTTKSSHHRTTNPTHSVSSGGGDPLLARRCANCDTTSTPLWRNGPKGPKSLCNACGIRFKKEERRATAAAATNSNIVGGRGGILESHVAGGYYNAGGSAWGDQHQHQHQPQKVQYFSAGNNNEFRFMDDVETTPDSDSAGMFLSWRLNVTDRPTSLVHDFTR